MAGLLRDDFSPKRPITQVPTAWFNAVAKILNGITAGVGININKNGTDTAGWEFELDLEFARKYLGIEGGGGKPTDLTHEDITDWDDATADFLTQGDLDGYATEADVDAVSDLVLDLTDVVDGILADYVSTDDLTTTLSFYSNTETIANTYATKTALSAVDDDLTALAQIVEDMDADLADLLDWADALDADLYDAQGAKKWVDTSTAQTVGGVKTFSAITKHNSHIEISGSNSLRMFLNRNNGVQGWESISFFTLDNVNIGQVICGNDNASIHGTYLRSYNGGSIYSGIGVHLDVNDKGAQNLERPPTEDNSSTSDTQIAWRGWVNNYFSRKTHNHDGVYSKTDHTHTGYATTNHTHTGYATTGSVTNLSNALTNLTNIVNTINENYVTQDALTTKLSVYSTTEQISGAYVTKASFNSLDAEVGEIEADLADIIADLDDLWDVAITTDDISQAFINATRNGQSGSFEFVTNVAWTGSALTQTKRTVTVTNGLITNLGSSGSASTIDNAVLFEVT